MAIFLVVIALITGYLLGLNRRAEVKPTAPEQTKSKEGYSAGYYQAIKDVRKTAKILNRNGEAAPVDKVLTTLLGQAETPSYEVQAKAAKTTKASSAKPTAKKSLLTSPVKTADILPNITLVVGAVLILASASLMTVLIEEPLITSVILMMGVVVFFALALRFTNVKSYLPAGLTFLGLSVALIPLATAPIPGLTAVSQWIITSIVATGMLAYVSRTRSFAIIPYATTIAFFSLVMSIARGLTDDIFWSFVAVIVVTMAIYMVRLKKPLYIAMKFDTPAILSTAWLPGVTAFVSLFYISSIGIEKIHIILALAVAYYLVVWLSTSRYIHELIAKFIGVILLSSITYEHIAPIGTVYASLSFALIGVAMVSSSLVGWKRAKEKRYIFAYEVAWLVAGFATLWYAYLLASAASGNYIFAAVLALIAMALSLLVTQVSQRVWFSVNAIFAVAMAVVSISQWLIVLVNSWDQVYFITASLMISIGAFMLWVYVKTDKVASYIAAGGVLFFAYLAFIYLSQTEAAQIRLPEILVAVLSYVVAKRQKWPVLYIVGNVILFIATSLSIQSLGEDRYGTFALLGILSGLIILSVMAFLQKENVRKWTLASIVLITLPAYVTAKSYMSTPGAYDTLRYASLSILVIGTAAAHLLQVRSGAVRGVRLAHELTAYGLLILLIEFLQTIDVSGYIHQAIYAHIVGVALVYVSLYVYKGDRFKKQAMVRQVIAAIIVSGSLANYALGGEFVAQMLFLVEHAIILAVALRFQVRWLVYWASAMLVFAALWILQAPASIMLFLVGIGLIAFVVRSVSKSTR